MSGGGRQPVKVVIINTQYVETDAVSFKSVVQKLTGKDSTVAVDSMSESPFLRKGMARSTEGIQSGVDMSYHGNSVLSRKLSFREFDRLLMELPPLDELYQLCAD